MHVLRFLFLLFIFCYYKFYKFFTFATIERHTCFFTAVKSEYRYLKKPNFNFAVAYRRIVTVTDKITKLTDYIVKHMRKNQNERFIFVVETNSEFKWILRSKNT